MNYLNLQYRFNIDFHVHLKEITLWFRKKQDLFSLNTLLSRVASVQIMKSRTFPTVLVTLATLLILKVFYC